VNKGLNDLSDAELINNQNLRTALTGNLSTASMDTEAQRIQTERNKLQLQLKQIIDSIDSFVSNLEKKVSEQLNVLKEDSALNKYAIGTARNQDFKFDLTMQATTFDGIQHQNKEINSNEFVIESSFLEKASFDYLWIFAHKKYLGGMIEIYTATTSTDKEKIIIKSEVIKKISELLRNLRPEEDIIIENLKTEINQLDGVLGTAIKPEHIALYSIDSNKNSIILDRTDDEKISIEVSEKVYLSETLLRIKI
jgi:hypothetical protein